MGAVTWREGELQELVALLYELGKEIDAMLKDVANNRTNPEPARRAKSSYNPYARGLKYCPMCVEWFKTESLRCPWCNRRLRCGSLHPRKKRELPRISVPDDDDEVRGEGP